MGPRAAEAPPALPATPVPTIAAPLCPPPIDAEAAAALGVPAEFTLTAAYMADDQSLTSEEVRRRYEASIDEVEHIYRQRLPAIRAQELAQLAADADAVRLGLPEPMAAVGKDAPHQLTPYQEVLQRLAWHLTAHVQAPGDPTAVADRLTDEKADLFAWMMEPRLALWQRLLRAAMSQRQGRPDGQSYGELMGRQEDPVWLDQPARNWNQPGASVPPCPVSPYEIFEAADLYDGIAALPATRGQRAVQEAGWVPMRTAHWGRFEIVAGVGVWDGLGHWLRYQLFAFENGRFLGSLSPEMITERWDGGGCKVSHPSAHGFRCAFERYAEGDALGRASLEATVRYRIKNAPGGGRVLVAEAIDTHKAQKERAESADP